MVFPLTQNTIRNTKINVPKAVKEEAEKVANPKVVVSNPGFSCCVLCFWDALYYVSSREVSCYWDLCWVWSPGTRWGWLQYNRITGETHQSLIYTGKCSTFSVWPPYVWQWNAPNSMLDESIYRGQAGLLGYQTSMHPVILLPALWLNVYWYNRGMSALSQNFSDSLIEFIASIKTNDRPLNNNLPDFLCRQNRGYR